MIFLGRRLWLSTVVNIVIPSRAFGNAGSRDECIAYGFNSHVYYGLIHEYYIREYSHLPWIPDPVGDDKISMELKDQLQNLGLSDKEAKIFLACLELGMATAYEIAGYAKIKRTTAYAVLDQLTEKKLVSFIFKKDRKLFTAINPRKIIEIWQDKEAEINKQQNLILDIVPYLESIYNQSPHKPKIRFFQGVGGLQDLHNEIIKDKVKVIYYLAAVRYAQEILGQEFYQNWIKQRVKAGIKAMGIRKKAEEVASNVYTGRDEYLRDYRFAPSWVNLPMEVQIFGHKVAIMSSKKELFGFVVESPEFALLMKSLFDVLWNVSEET